MNTTLVHHILLECSGGRLLGSDGPALLAYIGPGVGLSALGALWGLVATIVVPLSVMLLRPFRALFRKLTGRHRPPSADGEPQPAADL